MMSIPNHICTKCKEIEPQDWDFNRDGLWICNCPSFRPKKRTDGKKPIDAFFDQLNQEDSVKKK